MKRHEAIAKVLDECAKHPQMTVLPFAVHDVKWQHDLLREAMVLMRKESKGHPGRCTRGTCDLAKWLAKANEEEASK